MKDSSSAATCDEGCFCVWFHDLNMWSPKAIGYNESRILSSTVPEVLKWKGIFKRHSYHLLDKNIAIISVDLVRTETNLCLFPISGCSGSQTWCLWGDCQLLRSQMTVSHGRPEWPIPTGELRGHGRPEWPILTCELRGHGRSEWLIPTGEFRSHRRPEWLIPSG